jgi:hypothetical protein
LNRSEFDKYLGYFNSRDYKNAKSYFADDLVLQFAGYVIKGKKGFSDFYAFFHKYVDERVIVKQFAGDDENVIIDVIVRLEGKKDLTEKQLKENDYERLGAIKKGQIIEIPQFIHYRIVRGLFKEIRCVIKDVN